MLVLLTACGSTMNKSIDMYRDKGDAKIQPSPLAQRLIEVPELDGKTMTIAVYSFSDKT